MADDDSNPTTDDNFTEGASLPYIIAGSATLPLFFVVIYTFLKYKQLRKHPAGLLLGRTFSDLGFVLSIVSLSIITDWIENEIDTIDEGKTLTKTCDTWGILTILFLNTSQFYFIGMCYDLYVTLKYPLRSQSYTAKQVHFYSWFIGGLMAVVAYIYNSIISHDLSYSSSNEVCFFDKSSLSWHSLPIFIFGIPYIIGVLSGIASLIMVFIRLKHGLGDVFDHAKRVVNEHIFFVSLYVLLGIIWWTLLLIPIVETQLVPFIIIIVVGTPLVDFLSWIFQKFRTPFYKLKSKRQERSELFSLLRARSISTLNANQDDYIEMATLQESDKMANKKEQCISSALRMELIRSICGGISDAVSCAHKQSQLFDDPNNITPLHFAPYDAIGMKIGSDRDRDYIVNQCIQRFNINSNKNQGKYQFIDYSPHVFKYLRKFIYKCNDYQYIESITLNDNADINNVSAKFSEGKSGSFFFQTQDNIYMIKTIDKSEMKTFLKMLPGYFEHIRKYPDSFINRYYGAYSIKLYGTKIYFTVLKNIFTPGLEPHEKYDIKGSWRNRHTNYHIEEGRLMKDEDLHKNILLSHQQSKKSWDQLNTDTRFLTNLGIMDYSLLLGIYYIGVGSHDIIQSGRNWTFAHGFMFQTEGIERNDQHNYTPPLSPDITIQRANHNISNEQHMKIQIDEYDREIAEKNKKLRKFKMNRQPQFVQAQQSRNNNVFKYNVNSSLIERKGLLGKGGHISSIVEEDESLNTSMHSIQTSQSSVLNEPQPSAYQHKNSLKTDPDGTPSIITDDQSMSPIKKHSLIEMKEMQPTQRADAPNSLVQNIGSFTDIDDLGTPQNDTLLDVDDDDRRDSISYLKLDPSLRKKTSNVHSNLHHKFSEPSVTIPSTLPEASISMTPKLDEMAPISPTDDTDDDDEKKAISSYVGTRNSSTINTSTQCVQRNSDTLYQQSLIISPPNTTIDSNLISPSSYNTAQQRMSLGGQAPSALVPSEDIDSKTLRDIQSIAPDDEENIKLLKHEQAFLRRRAFTSSSGLQQVCNTKNTFQARTIEGPGFYCLGIIDILQEWNWNKKLERYFKIYFRCQDSYGISCIEPTLYRKRFLAKMLQIGIGRKTAHV